MGTDRLCLCDFCCPHAAECKNHESQESCYLLAGGSLLPWRTFAAVLAACHSFPFLGTQSSRCPHFLQLRGGSGPSRRVRVKPLASKSMAYPSLSEANCYWWVAVSRSLEGARYFLNCFSSLASCQFCVIHITCPVHPLRHTI